jgi:hypothetical protein
MTSRWRKHGHLPFLLIVVRPAFPALWMWESMWYRLCNTCNTDPFSTSVPPVAVTSGQGAAARVLWHVTSLGIHCGYSNPRLPACCLNKFIPYYTNRRQQPSLLFHWFLSSYFWLHSLRQFSLQLHLVTLNFLRSFYITCRIKYTRFV